jgi:hypothetical protein
MGRAHNQAIDINDTQETLATTNRQCSEVRVNQSKIKNKKKKAQRKAGMLASHNNDQ